MKIKFSLVTSNHENGNLKRKETLLAMISQTLINAYFTVFKKAKMKEKGQDS